MKKILLFVTMAVICVSTANSQRAATPNARSLDVLKFDVAKNVDFPETWLNTMMTEVVEELIKTKQFSDVKLAPGSGTTVIESTTRTATSDVDRLVLTGAVTRFDAGDRTARYLIGFGSGKTKVVAHIRLVDSATGKILLESDVYGKMVMGLFGGNSHAATRGLAIEVRKVVKKAMTK